MNRIYIVILFSIIGTTSFAQNLLYNPSFEEYVECPKKIDAYGVLTIVEAWFQPTPGSADYFHKCGAKESGIPQNKMGSQYPRTGLGMCGIYCSSNEYREYLQTELKQKLKKGARYRLSLYVSLSEYSSGAVATIGGLFTQARVLDTSKAILKIRDAESRGKRITQSFTAPYVPQVYNVYERILDNTVEWMKVEGEFLAEGGEGFLTIGNFFTEDQSNLSYPEGLTYLLPGAYYYLDDIELVCLDCEEKTGKALTEESLSEQQQYPDLKVGDSYVLHNIFFEFNKSVLLQQSYVELQQLLFLLQTYPQMRIEIVGHTDAKGSVDYNQVLSEQRAKSVVDYLLKKGISPDRLKYKGFGKSKPIDSNETKEGREKNRRVEFKIVNI